MVPIDFGGPAVFHCLTISRRASARDTPRVRAVWTFRSISTMTLSGSSVFMAQSVDPPRDDGQESDEWYFSQLPRHVSEMVTIASRARSEADGMIEA